ncbi:polysaccharide deacetylase family protein [Streptomyces sp. NPDC048641]|uniref:polysaccharide deacetylase family protein n=1 Tax=Streptomyces sp. NPDC048641 TaxID=3154825 RepID=UPI0034311446
MRTGPRRLLAAALAAGVLAPALLTGCARSVDPIERLSRKAAEKVSHSSHPRHPNHLNHPAPAPTPGEGVAAGAAGAAGGAGDAGSVGGGSWGVRSGSWGARGGSWGAPGGSWGASESASAPGSGKAAGRAPAHATPLKDHASEGGPAPDAYRRWGLSAPLAPAPRPPARHAAGAGPRPYALPPVVDHVRTKDRVVFLTFDDGVERDPHFADMVRDLRLPVSVFLTDGVAGPGRDPFGKLRTLGAGVQNQTLNRHSLPALPYAEQHAEICGQQDRLKDRFGTRPRLLRPPFGDYDQDTLRAAATCGVDAVVLWHVTLRSDHLRDADAAGDRPRPGDIVRAEFRDGDDPHGTALTDMTARLLRRIQAQGFTVGRLEDYL